MAFFSSLHSANLLLIFILISAFAFVNYAATPIQFRVGGPLGWRKPTGLESETYSHWAGRNRFHVCDSLYFKYEKDSVLVVDQNHFSQCNATKPLLRFTDGNTTFQFGRFGYFHFISGEPGHCQAGQKLILRVMVHPKMTSLAPAQAPIVEPDAGSGSWRIEKPVSVLAIGMIGMAWMLV